MLSMAILKSPSHYHQIWLNWYPQHYDYNYKLLNIASMHNWSPVSQHYDYNYKYLVVA